jgi:hypothetical protein
MDYITSSGCIAGAGPHVCARAVRLRQVGVAAEEAGREAWHVKRWLRSRPEAWVGVSRTYPHSQLAAQHVPQMKPGHAWTMRRALASSSISAPTALCYSTTVARAFLQAYNPAPVASYRRRRISEGITTRWGGEVIARGLSSS